MTAYLFRRLVQFVPTMFLVSVLIFVLVRALPGDAVAARMGDSGRYSDEQIAQFREDWRLDDSLVEQYIAWSSAMLRGDFGRSFLSDGPVLDEVTRTFPVTFELTIAAVFVGMAVGIPLGVVSAAQRGRVSDYAARVVAIIGLAIPNFWVGTLLIVVPAFAWGYFPPLAFARLTDDPVQNLQQLAAPVFTLSLPAIAVLSRVTRSAVLEVLQDDYVRTAKAKGLGSGLIYRRHVMRNAAVPIITVLGLELATLIGGSVIVEQIFDIPGMGRLTIEAILLRDYPQLQFNILVISAILLLVNLALDLAYTIVDPRIRLQ